MSQENERSSGLTKLLSEARGDAPSAERLSGVLAALEAELGPLEAPTHAPSSGAPKAPGAPFLAMGIVLAVMTAVVLWPRAPREDASAPRAVREERVEAVDATPRGEGVRAPEPVEVMARPVETAAPVEAPEPAVREPAVSDTARGPRARPEVEAPVDLGSELREEMAWMERAMAAREAGDLRAARAALSAHRRRFPEGRLAPDRERLERQLDESAPAETVDDTPSTP